MKRIAHLLPGLQAVLAASFVVLCLSSCSKAKDVRAVDEEAGCRSLAGARSAFYAKHYDEARDSIMSLRQNHPLALEARKQGILLLDSIELFAAQDSLDALNMVAQRQYMSSLDNPDAPLQLDSATYVDEHERLDMKIKFFERKIQEDKVRK
ncbi:MAG: hypothetical protein MJZ35_02205 [Bacteroidaceae bacterium]|nr:hypothetical protein [Bacteroidaceae bacterium]